MSFESATAASAVGPDTYHVNLAGDWCIGAVPNGGYVTSVLLSVARLHFQTTLSHLAQPDTMSLQLQFLRRTMAGPAVVTMKEVKLGASVSVLRAVLAQDGRDRVEGYVTQTNFATQDGLSLDTEYTTSGMSQPPPPADLALLERCGEDENWRLDPSPPNLDFRKAMQHMMFHLPKQSPALGVVDQWVRFRPGGKDKAPFTDTTLGYVVDIFPLLVEQFPEIAAQKRQTRWYPTVTLNLEIKRRLPPAGVNWLFVRVRGTEIRNGRMDLQIIVLDEARNVVALSSHINLILSASRNLAGRGEQSGKEDKGGKL